MSSRGRALATFGGVMRIGIFAGPAVGGLVGAAWGLKWVFGLYAALALVLLAFSGALFAGASQVSRLRQTRAVERPARMLQLLILHARSFATAGLGQLLGQTIRSGRAVLLPLFGAGVIGLGVKDLGLILSISAGIEMLMFTPAGMIMDRLGRKYAIVPCFVIFAIGMGLLPFADSFSSLLLAACVMGLGNGLGSGAMMTLGADLAPREANGEFLGIWRLIGDVGWTGGPLLVGWVAELVGLASAGFALAGVGFLTAGTPHASPFQWTQRKNWKIRKEGHGCQKNLEPASLPNSLLAVAARSRLTFAQGSAILRSYQCARRSFRSSSSWPLRDFAFFSDLESIDSLTNASQYGDLHNRNNGPCR